MESCQCLDHARLFTLQNARCVMSLWTPPLASSMTMQTRGAARALTALHAWLAEEIKALADRPDLPSIAARPDVALRVDGLISILRGAAGGCGPRSQPPLWALVRAVIGPLTVLAEAFHADATITCLLLKLAGDIVEAHISYLPVTPSQKPHLPTGLSNVACPRLWTGLSWLPIPIRLSCREMADGVTPSEILRPLVRRGRLL